MEDYSVKYWFERGQGKKKREIRIGNAQGIGQRDEQQDSFGYVIEEGENGFVAAVLCDGMGGLDSGREASLFSAERVMNYIKEKKEKIEVVKLCEKIQQINQELFRTNLEKGVRSGSTLITGIMKEDRFFWAAVGDSRIYLYRKNQIYQINRDHNYYQLLLRQFFCGEITWQQVEQAQGKAALASYIGKNCENQIDYSEKGIHLEHKDKILICSDGIYQNITKEEMIRELGRHSQEASEWIKHCVKRKRIPGQDNLTVMVLEYRKDHS